MNIYVMFNHIRTPKNIVAMLLLNFIEPMTPCLHLPNQHCFNTPSMSTPPLRACAMTMGPVSSAIVLYAMDRAVRRLVAGQILRKGVVRKMKRLMRMMSEFSVVSEIVQDVIEDVFSQ
jgi:hypothetical protein